MNDQEFFIIVCLLSAAKDDKIKKSWIRGKQICAILT
jgi:hypothetical protein